MAYLHMILKVLMAAISFGVVFISLFFICGWFIMPHVPPYPETEAHPFEVRYWIDNWVGLIVGASCGAISVYQSFRGGEGGRKGVKTAI